MANRAGLRKVVKTVRGKKGSVRRTYWVRAGDAVKSGARAAGGFAGRHKGAIAATLALATLAGVAHHGNNVYKAYHGQTQGIYGDMRASGMGRVKSAANAAGWGTVLGTSSIGGRVESVARSGADRARAANSDAVLNARIAGSVFSTVYDQQRGPGSQAGRLTSAYRAARSVWGGMRGA